MPATEPHKRTAEAAEEVRLAVEGQSIVDLLRDYRTIDTAIDVLGPGILWPTCTCPTYATCMNVACPRAIKVTC